MFHKILCSFNLKCHSFFLVGGFNPSEKYEFISWDDDYSQSKMETCSSHVPVTTNQHIYTVYYRSTILEGKSTGTLWFETPMDPNPNRSIVAAHRCPHFPIAAGRPGSPRGVG